jgi:hypothetical protein
MHQTIYSCVQSSSRHLVHHNYHQNEIGLSRREKRHNTVIVGNNKPRMLLTSIKVLLVRQV